MGWDEASAPGQVGQKLERLVTAPPAARQLGPRHDERHALGDRHRLGLSSTACSPARTSRHPWIGALALGPVVWLSGYVILPLAGVYKPIWKYDARTLAKDLSAHLVYGAATSAAFAAASRRHDR